MLVSYAAIHCALTQHPSEEKGAWGGGGGLLLEVLYGEALTFSHT